ncbi:hypothetical protein ILUMI_06586 [Ignelater luminosus]|uniref:Uncharacterized protein n=1 Tax=Ignelater luminosus TaxID=2038154 RepID=A0A8K0DF77_IGNLU|nr:hypothetical protein ILUMI_06586 [Ignelater luminosus]
MTCKHIDSKLIVYLFQRGIPNSSEARPYIRLCHSPTCFLLYSSELHNRRVSTAIRDIFAMAVADAVYFSNWYSQHPSLRVPLLLIIQNSQKEITIKGGGLVTINAETVVNVLKVAWSSCSLMRGLR